VTISIRRAEPHMLRIINRRPRLKLPSDIAGQLALDCGERPLAWAVGTDGRWYVGTDRALHLSGDAGWRTLRWEQIERADWERDSERLAIVEVVGWGLPEIRTELSLVDPGHLLELVRERVTKSVVLTVYAAVRGRRGLSVVGRRSPLGAGEVLWSYLLAEGLDPEDPQVDAVAERTLGEARAELAWL
jgi:hypothetical protein